MLIQHGMGIPSVGILLHEIIKLMYHARVRDPVFFRLGTCGGIGLDGGQLVITNEAVDGLMRPYLELVKPYFFPPSEFDQQVLILIMTASSRQASSASSKAG